MISKLRHNRPITTGDRQLFEHKPRYKRKVSKSEELLRYEWKQHKKQMKAAKKRLQNGNPLDSTGTAILSSPLDGLV